jgi:hypothetical protein
LLNAERQDPEGAQAEHRVRAVVGIFLAGLLGFVAGNRIRRS